MEQSEARKTDHRDCNFNANLTWIFSARKKYCFHAQYSGSLIINGQLMALYTYRVSRYHKIRDYCKFLGSMFKNIIEAIQIL